MGLWCALPAGVQTLAAFMAADYATGLACAWRGVSHKSEGGTLSSKAGFDGLLRKGMMALVVVINFANGNQGVGRWIYLGFFQFQPSEIMKLGIIIIMEFCI